MTSIFPNLDYIMLIRTLSTIILWSLMGVVVYSTKEAGAMWILNLARPLHFLGTQFLEGLVLPQIECQD